jgi:hypothetical protein
MPIYQTKSDDVPIGRYSAQRPSVAACKSFTSLRRRNKDLKKAEITVVTEGPKKIIHDYSVSYDESIHDLLGLMFRPVAVLKSPQQHIIK